MTDYSDQVDRIRNATTLEVRRIARDFSAGSMGEGGITYSGWTGNVPSSAVAREIAHRTGLPIIDDTPRGRFLSSKPVEMAIKETVERIAKEQGQSVALAEKTGSHFLYGDAKAPSDSPVSVRSSLWGRGVEGLFQLSARGRRCRSVECRSEPRAR